MCIQFILTCKPHYLPHIPLICLPHDFMSFYYNLYNYYYYNNPLPSSTRVAICNLPVFIVKEKWFFSLSIHPLLRASRLRVGLRRPSRIRAGSLAGLILFWF